MPDRHDDHPIDLGAVIADTHAHGDPAEGGYSSRAERREARTRHTRRRRRRGRRGTVILIALLVVGLGAFGAYTALKPFVAQLTASNDYTGAGTGKVNVTIPEGASGRAIGRALESAGVVKTSKAFIEAAQQNPKSGSSQPGEYTLRKKMSAANAVTLRLDPKSRSADRGTIREGLRASEV